MNAQGRLGLIIPSSNRLTEPQFHRYSPPELAVHVMRLRLTGPWQRPLPELHEAIGQAAAVLSDVKPDLIVFHCTASSMEGGADGEHSVVAAIHKATSRPAITTGQAITEALRHLRIKKLVLISPYPAHTHGHEIRYLTEAGFQVVHDFCLGLSGGEAYPQVSAKEWREIVLRHTRAEADGYLLSCTNTTMIESIEDCERHLNCPVVSSNQAVLWASLRKIGFSRPLGGLGTLLSGTPLGAAG